ncbi:hypothetical protein FRC06_009102 [Ceratobasidium sp. 370]|nr:hypothetical protein FRC06_009102 [Ceratobasidium sp. 370]
MSGPALPDSPLLSAIQALSNTTAELPQSTPEGLANGIIWKNFNTKPEDVQGLIFEKIDQAFTWCFPRDPESKELQVDNVLRGAFRMDLVINFFKRCAHSSKMTSSDLHLTTLKVKRLTDLVYMRHFHQTKQVVNANKVLMPDNKDAT